MQKYKSFFFYFSACYIQELQNLFFRFYIYSAFILVMMITAESTVIVETSLSNFNEANYFTFSLNRLPGN